jgi:signal transduction histidine kinase
MLDVLGLGPTLRWHLAERLRNPSPVGHISIELGHNRFPPEIENACFRVIQEAVTNVLRHANARQIWVQVQEEAGALVMVVKDDGSGFEVVTARARASAQGAGLAGMQERVALAGGSFELRSKPGEGTLIRARVPLGTGK